MLDTWILSLWTSLLFIVGKILGAPKMLCVTVCPLGPPRLPQTGLGSPGAAASPGDIRNEKGRHYCSAGCRQEQEQGQGKSRSRSRRMSRSGAGPEEKGMKQVMAWLTHSPI